MNDARLGYLERQIVEILNCDADTAIEVGEFMYYMFGRSISAMSNFRFKLAVKTAYREVLEYRKEEL